MTTKDTIRAFPGETVQKNGMHSSVRVLHGGMSLRDWFAGQALAGKMSIESIEFLSREDIADRCYRQADAMLAARGADQ